MGFGAGFGVGKEGSVGCEEGVNFGGMLRMF